MKCLSYHHCSEVLSVAVSGKHRSLLRACLISLDGISETVRPVVTLVDESGANQVYELLAGAIVVLW